MSSIDLACDVPEIERSLRDWLEAGALDPPVRVTLDVRVADRWVEVDDARRVFEQPGVEIRSGPPEDGVAISWQVAPARAVIPAGSTVAQVVLSREAAGMVDRCTRTFMTTVLIFLLRRVGWHHVHAATAIDPLGRGWLLAGNAHAGKSTTAALLASRGWRVGTDDTAFLVSDGERVSVVARRGPIALREGGCDLVARSRGGKSIPERGKTGFWPEELGGAWVSRIDPELLLFTSVGDATTSARRLSPGEALPELVRWSAWVMLEPELADEHLELIRRLAQQVRSYRVTFGRDLFEGSACLEDLVA